MDHNIACRLSSRNNCDLASLSRPVSSPRGLSGPGTCCNPRVPVPRVPGGRFTSGYANVFLWPGTARGVRRECRVAGRGGVARAGRASIVTHIDILRGAVSKGRAKFPPNLPNLREPASDQNYLAWASSKVSPCPRDRRASPSAPSFASRCFLRGSHVCW